VATGRLGSDLRWAARRRTRRAVALNRYRAVTLSSSWSAALPWTDAYLKYCADHEDRCLRNGRSQQRWTNAACSRNFSGGLPGDLKAGAPPWKQRALYDAVKDTTPTTNLGIAIARVAIYDLVACVPLDDILEGQRFRRAVRGARARIGQPGRAIGVLSVAPTRSSDPTRHDAKLRSVPIRVLPRRVIRRR
jgi:hypothetical protein